MTPSDLRLAEYVGEDDLGRQWAQARVERLVHGVWTPDPELHASVLYGPSTGRSEAEARASAYALLIAHGTELARTRHPKAHADYLARIAELDRLSLN